MRIKTVGLVVTFVLVILLAPCAADAQPQAKVTRIGFLRRAAPQAADFEAFQQGLRALGYMEGHNIAIEQRYADGVQERLPDLAAELVRLPVDVIVVDGTLPAKAVKTATSSIPIVFTLVGDPVGSGLVASFARPGGNLTGLSQIAPEHSGKRLELLKKAVPQAARVAVLLNPANPAPASADPPLSVVAQAVGVQLHVFEVRDPQEFESTFSAMSKWGADALLTLPDGMFFSQRARIVELAAKHRLSAMYEAREFVEAGGLMSYGVSFPDLWRRAATYVDKILKGAKPADLPVQTPWKFEFVINLKTAEALGLTLPPHLQIFADEVIR